MRTVLVVCIAAVISLSGAEATAQTIERVSVSSDEVEANGDSFLHHYDAVSADGRFVVFESDANNLVPNDGNALRDVFLRDRAAGTTIRVSEAWNGGDALGESRYPSISEDGRWIAFSSDAPDIVADDTNGAQDVFVFDRQTGQIARISLTWNGSEGNDSSRTPSISGNGRYVAFRSNATNLLFQPLDQSRSIYVRDLQTGANQLASLTWDDLQENGGSWFPHMSADGRHVAFISNSTNLVDFDTNDVNDIFIRHLDLGVTMMISANVDGGAANGNSGGFGISADGRFAGIFSNATDLLPPGVDGNGLQDAFVRDLEASFTERVSVSSTGEEATGLSQPATLDGSGRYAVFSSEASNLVVGDANGVTDTFARDRTTGITTLISVTAAGIQANADCVAPTVSADGRFVVFHSLADNLVPYDTLGHQDVFIAYGPSTTLADGFEAGDTSRWSATVR